MVEQYAYGKINLFLDIDSIRTDGYHNIKSIMQSIDWYDIIRIKHATCDEIKITSNNTHVPTDSSNIVYRAAKAFFINLNINEGLEIHIEKNIPMAAGMAGGSADGAATLHGLNELYGYPFELKKLIEIGREIGADIPFCLVGGTKAVGGIGEIIDDVTPLSPCFILCAKHCGSDIQTSIAYKELDALYENFHFYKYDKDKYDRILSCLKSEDIKGVCQNTFNIFEAPTIKKKPIISDIKNIMIKNGALCAMMSGSGPSVFGIYDDVNKAQDALEQLVHLGTMAKICTPTQKKG